MPVVEDPQHAGDRRYGIAGDRVEPVAVAVLFFQEDRRRKGRSGVTGRKGSVTRAVWPEDVRGPLEQKYDGQVHRRPNQIGDSGAAHRVSSRDSADVEAIDRHCREEPGEIVEVGIESGKVFLPEVSYVPSTEESVITIRQEAGADEDRRCDAHAKGVAVGPGSFGGILANPSGDERRFVRSHSCRLAEIETLPLEGSSGAESQHDQCDSEMTQTPGTSGHGQAHGEHLVTVSPRRIFATPARPIAT